MTDTSNSRPETVEANPPEITGAAGPTEKAVTQGRAARTPFALLGGVALTVWAFVAVVAAVVLLVWWLG